MLSSLVFVHPDKNMFSLGGGRTHLKEQILVKTGEDILKDSGYLGTNIFFVEYPPPHVLHYLHL